MTIETDGDPKPQPKSDAPPPADPPKAFNQDDVDRIVQDRLARERKDRPTDEEIADLKSKADKLGEIEAANLTEQERLQVERDAAVKAAEDATTRANQTLRKAAILSAAAEAGADSEIVHALLAQNGFKVEKDDTTFEVTVDDSGSVTGATEAVKALIALKNIAGNPTPPGPGDGGPRQPVPAQTRSVQIAEAEAAGDIKKSMSLKSQQLAEQMVGTKT